MKFNFTNPWGDLREVCLGTVYPPSFFSSVTDEATRNALSQILHETIEDLDQIAVTLKSLGIKVHRPTVPENLTVSDFVDDNNQLTKVNTCSNSLIPRPPLQVRDSFFVCDDTLYQSKNDGPYVQALIDSLHDQTNYRNLTEFDFDAPLVSVFSDRLFVDTLEIPDLGETLEGIFSNKKVIAVSSGGHNDAVFAIIKPGVIITLEDPEIYQETFPGWDVLSMPNASWRSALKDFRELKVQNGGKWWSPGAINNPEFIKFVNSWLFKWVGYAQETVFDTNCLVINQNLVLVNNYDAEVEKFFKKHDVEFIVVPFRHRFFWDGGIHCITNDLVRGNQ